MQTSHQSRPPNDITDKEEQQMQQQLPHTQESQKRRRRRRRPRNRTKAANKHQPKESSPTFAPSLSQETRYDLKDLTREASALEKQLNELQTQLNINLANIPKDQGRRINAIAREQVTATEDEMDYVRKRLKTVYQQILNCDLLYASSQHVEDRLWRYIFYPPIEETRSRLRKLQSSDPSTVWQNLITTYHQYIDSSFKFYRDLNHNIKTVYHVDTKTIGIDVFRHQVMASAITDEDKVAILLQSNYICMGDLARYRASFPSTGKASPKDDNNNSLSSTANAWKISKTCYQKAVDVYRSSGKPYSQLALVSASTGSVIDVVWYYSMSLAMKQPSSLGFANLKSFYSKVRFTFSKPLPTDSSGLADQMKASDCISHFVESFLQMHHAIVFQKNDSFPPISHGLGLAMTQTITALMTESGLDLTLMKNVSSIFHIVRSTLTRTITILLVSVWYMGEFMKAKANASHQSELQHLQMLLLDYGFDVLTNLFKTTNSILEQLNRDTTHDGSESIPSLSAMVDNTILPGLSIWCAYLYTNMDVIAQYCHGADGRHTMPLNGKSKDATKRSLVRSIQTFCSCLIGHPSFPLPVNNVLPSSYPLSEDVLLLGLVPLRSFHSSVDFFKETAYEVDEQTTADARQQVRWCRAREFIRKIAESQSFNFVQYNQAEQNYSVIDENAKRQQQSRFMKALATQRLMEQVSSLEKNVNKMNVSPKKAGEKSSSKPENMAAEQVDVYVVIVDVTAFLDGLAKVKKWANQTLNVRRRVQSSILQVVVPLDVIDVLDLYKKGDSHMNLQARESIRYLDHQLTLAANNKEQHTTDDSNTKKTPARSFLRTQKVDENLGDWDQASSFWIDDDKNAHKDDADHHRDDNDDAHNDNNNEEMDAMDNQTALTDSDDVDDASISSGDDLFKSHGRRRGRRFMQDDDDEQSDSNSDTDDTATDDDYSTEEDDDNYSESGDDDDEDDNDDVSDLDEVQKEDVNDDDNEDDYQELSYTDVPKTYRPILNCMLHFYQQQQKSTSTISATTSAGDQVEHLVLVTNDEDLTAWAERFGDPSSGKSLAVYTVHEWDRILNTRTFERKTNTSRRPK